jgi:hypothetical protein
MKEAVVVSLIISLVIVLEMLVASLPVPMLLLYASLAMMILIPASYFNLRNRITTRRCGKNRRREASNIWSGAWHG